jgi:competence protein ComEA
MRSVNYYFSTGDALILVGGVLPAADLTAVNLAHKLIDEEMIYIPKKGEKPKSYSGQGASASSAAASTINDAVININTTNEAQLDRLPGVGPSTAKKIISYRNEKGKFSSIEDIKNVPGIGEQKFKELKDKIKVE